MFFAHLLATALVAMTILSTVSPVPTPVDILFEDVDVHVKKDETTMAVDGVLLSGSSSGRGRSFDLSFIMALQNSSIWSEIKERSITVMGDSDAVEMFDKSPEDMSDEELLEMKNICHDGFKCVAVDQLLVLNTITEPMEDGLMSVRTAIVKITKVITEYTTEYHEDRYQYEEVNESDDYSKINETVTTIVEDNAELCRIYIDRDTNDATSDEDDTTSDENGTKFDADTNTIPDEKDMEPDAPKGITLVNNVYLNLGTINNISVNNGTMNSADITMEPSDVTLVQDVSKESIPKADVAIVIDPKNDMADNDDDNGYCTCGDKPNTISPSCSKHAVGDMSPASVMLKNETSRPENSENQNQNSANSDNGEMNGPIADNEERPENKTDVNIMAVGRNNNNRVHKGYVENGYLNNKNMNVNTVNGGTNNKGLIKRSNAKNGIINVGTVNNGPTNYGTMTNIDEDKSKSTSNIFNVDNYATNLSDIYTGILKSIEKDN